MFAFGFLSDRIVADYLRIKAKNVQNIVADLRKEHGWQTRRDMARAYEAMREKVKSQEVKKKMTPVEISKPTSLAASLPNGHTAAVLESPPPPVSPQRKSAAPGEFDPTAVYPAHIVEAAWEEMEKQPMGRRVKHIFTPEVVAVWLDWLEQGKPMSWIAENNGLIPTTHLTAKSYVDKHRDKANQLRGGEGWAAAPPPVVTPATVADPEAPTVTAAQVLDDLVTQLGQVGFSGKVVRTERGLKIDLEIEFGE